MFGLNELKSVLTAQFADEIHIRIAHHTENCVTAFFVYSLSNRFVDFHRESSGLVVLTNRPPAFAEPTARQAVLEGVVE